MNENTKICAICGHTHNIDDMTILADGESYVCEECRDDHCERCDCCGDWYRESDCALTGVNDGEEYYCESCLYDEAVRCDHCDEWYTERNIAMSDCSGTSICYHCSDRYQVCSNCGGIIREDDAWYDDDDEPYCHSCYHDSVSARPIQNYSYKPDPIIRLRRGENVADTLKFGLELEVDGGNVDPETTARKIIDAAEGRVYCKHDGSLDSGFEIVTHPGTLAHHQYEMHWANICRLAKNDGFRSHDVETCGLHIHVGRAELDPTGADTSGVIANIVVIVSKLRDELTKFSRRSEGRLDQWARIPVLDLSCDPAWLRQQAIDTRFGGRYQAVNLANSETVEFRIFKGTLKRDTIIASIQLVSNICQYASTHTITECAAVSYADIVNFKVYNELLAYSQSRRLITGISAS